jgi:hypothetical protein
MTPIVKKTLSKKSTSHSFEYVPNTINKNKTNTVRIDSSTEKFNRDMTSIKPKQNVKK